MKKKIIIVSILCVLTALLVACSSTSKPKGVSESTYNTAVQVLDITDQYLDLKIDAEDAKEKIDRLNERFVKSDVTSDLTIQTISSTIPITLSLVDTTDDHTDNDVIELRNQLAKGLNMKTR